MIQKHCPVVMAIISQASPFGDKGQLVGVAPNPCARLKEDKWKDE